MLVPWAISFDMCYFFTFNLVIFLSKIPATLLMADDAISKQSYTFHA